MGQARQVRVEVGEQAGRLGLQKGLVVVGAVLEVGEVRPHGTMEDEVLVEKKTARSFSGRGVWGSVVGRGRE